MMRFEYIMHRLWLIVNVYYIMYIYDESHFIGPFFVSFGLLDRSSTQVYDLA